MRAKFRFLKRISSLKLVETFLPLDEPSSVELWSAVKMDGGWWWWWFGSCAFPNLVFLFPPPLGSVCRMKIPVPAPALPPLHLQPISSSNRTPPPRRNEKAKPAWARPPNFFLLVLKGELHYECREVYNLIAWISLWLQTQPFSSSSFQVLICSGCSKWFEDLQLRFILDMLPFIPGTDVLSLEGDGWKQARRLSCSQLLPKSRTRSEHWRDSSP